MLAADDVSFRYSKSDVLRQVSVDVARGALIGVIGPNGSGKTTLLRCLGGLVTPSSGRVMLDGRDLCSFPRRALARHMAIVPQDTHLAFDFSVLEIVLMGRYPHLRAFAVEGPDDHRLAAQALASTGTADLAFRPFATLSGGERQRVAIASALAQLAGMSPVSGSRVLLLDEPTASLDLGYQLEVAELIQTLNADGITVVIATHDLNLAASICRDLVLLREGRILAAGPADDVITEDNIRALYGVEARVTAESPGGRTLIVPISRVR